MGGSPPAAAAAATAAPGNTPGGNNNNNSGGDSNNLSDAELEQHQALLVAEGGAASAEAGEGNGTGGSGGGGGSVWGRPGRGGGVSGLACPDPASRVFVFEINEVCVCATSSTRGEHPGEAGGDMVPVLFFCLLASYFTAWRGYIRRLCTARTGTQQYACFTTAVYNELIALHSR